MADNYQEFYDRCRNSSTGPTPSNDFPYQISLGTNPDGEELLPFHSGDTLGGQILVTESYDKLFHRILNFRRQDKGWRPLGSLAPVRLCDQTPTPRDNSPAHPSPRKNYLPQVHAHTVAFSWPSRTPV